MIAVTSIIRNEADIIELWVRHHISEGVDRFFIADHGSTDGTREILDRLAIETGDITIIDNTDALFYQERWLNKMLHVAGAGGATWVLSVDADEFMYAVCGQTIATVLDTMLGPGVQKLYVRTYQHRSWNERHQEPKRLSKVAVRYGADVTIAIGSHEASPLVGVSDVLGIRELQYRSYEHFVKKARASSATIPPEVRAVGGAWHHTRLDGLPEQELRREWERMCSVPILFDPIPSHMSIGSNHRGADQ